MRRSPFCFWIYLNRTHIYHSPSFNPRVNRPIFEYFQSPIPMSPHFANQILRKYFALLENQVTSLEKLTKTSMIRKSQGSRPGLLKPKLTPLGCWQDSREESVKSKLKPSHPFVGLVLSVWASLLLFLVAEILSSRFWSLSSIQVKLFLSRHQVLMKHLVVQSKLSD